MQKRELRRAVFGNESCIGRLPWLNTAVLVYVGVTVVSFVLLQIAPVLTWMAKAPLYHISTYLGLIGAVLMALDLFTNRGLWRGIWCWMCSRRCSSFWCPASRRAFSRCAAAFCPCW